MLTLPLAVFYGSVLVQAGYNGNDIACIDVATEWTSMNLTTWSLTDVIGSSSQQEVDESGYPIAQWWEASKTYSPLGRTMKGTFWDMNTRGHEFTLILEEYYTDLKEWRMSDSIFVIQWAPIRKGVVPITSFYYLKEVKWAKEKKCSVHVPEGTNHFTLAGYIAP